MNTQKIISCGEPSASSDVATKNYVDAFNFPLNTQTGNYTLLASDNNKRIVMDSGSATSIILNSNVFSANDTVYFVNKGTGTTTITPGTGSPIINNASGLSLSQNQSGTLVADSASNFFFFKSGVSIYGIATGAGTTGFTSSSITDNSINYTLLKWKDATGGQNNTMTVTTAGYFEFFVLAGGGGAGIGNQTSGSGGGGGAGQLIIQEMYLPAGNYTVKVGAGGTTGENNLFSGTRGGFSSIFQTTGTAGAYNTKITAIGGGGGGASSNSTANAKNNFRWVNLYYTDGWCGGGSAMPFNDEGTVTYGTNTMNQSTAYSIGGNNVIENNSFYGGTGTNDTTRSATGGGGGLSVVGGNGFVGSAGNTVGGTGGNGIFSSFSGISLGYGGGGSGGTSADTGHNLGANGHWCSATIAGTTLTITSIISGPSTIDAGYRVIALGSTSGSVVRNLATDVFEIYITARGTGTGGIGTYTLNSTFTLPSGNGIFINQYGNGVGGRNTDIPSNSYNGGSVGGSNSGSGGGGGANMVFNGGGGGDGGSGLVMVRYRV